MPRFVLLEHDHPSRHWDLMLESGAVLRTWRLTGVPTPGVVVAVEPSFDHRPLYLDYEGPIAGGRGSVVRHDAGTFSWEVDHADQVTVRLAGTRLRGLLCLERDEKGTWTAAFSSEG